MDLIYAQAVLTVIAACGDNAKARLVGLRPSPRHQVQKLEVVDGLRLVGQYRPSLKHSVPRNGIPSGGPSRNINSPVDG